MLEGVGERTLCMHDTTPSTPVHDRAGAPDRIALLSDIHANATALEAVLGDLPPVDAVVCLGDVVGYGPEPKRCVDRIREVAQIVLQGNHERTLEDPHRYAGHELAHDGLTHAVDRLAADDLDWASQLPPQVWYTPDVVLCHSHPDPTNRGMYLNDRTFETLVSGFERHGHDLVAFGHTHKQRTDALEDVVEGPVPSGRLVNPGSVGQPRDGDPQAAYAILDLGADEPSVELRRVAYDIEDTKRKIAAAGLPERSATRLDTGR